jgi:hypothetical protein
MQLTEAQKTISNSAARFRTCSAGRRFGKSMLSINELAKFARFPNQKCLYVAPTYRQAKTVIWDELKGLLLDRNWVKKVNESELIIYLVNGSTISVRSTDNHDALRGGKYNFIVLDEVADMNPTAWYQTLRPTLSDTGGHALFIGTPKGQGNWFFDLWTQGGNTEDWESWQYTTLEGGHVTAEEIEAAKRDMSEREFEQEYCARFITWAGQIFYAYSEENIKPYGGFADARTPLHIGMDFNVSPMSAVIAVKGANWLHIIDEIEIYGSNTFEMVTEIKRRYGDQRQMYVYPDASGAARSTNSPGVSNHIILQNNGFKLAVNSKNPPVAEAIASVNSLLCNTNGERRLWIDPKCKKTRECLIKHSYKEGTKIPDKDSGHDHLTDALRYVVHTLFPLKAIPQGGIGKSYRTTGRMM